MMLKTRYFLNQYVETDDKTLGKVNGYSFTAFISSNLCDEDVSNVLKLLNENSALETRNLTDSFCSHGDYELIFTIVNETF